MGTTLTGTTPQDTYDSLIKVTDNGPLSGTAKYLSDGLGNDSALALSNARVGIGTASPSNLLHLNKSSEPELYIQDSVATFRLGINSDNQFFVYTAQAKDIYFSNNNAERLRITSAGNVGIGTSAPATTLDVLGTSFLRGNVNAGKTANINVTTAVNGVGGGNREFTTFTGASATGFTGTDATDQGHGYFAATIVSGRSYEVSATMVVTNGAPLNFMTSTGLNFATQTVQTVQSSPVSDTTYRFVASGNASYFGVAASNSGGGMTCVVSNFSLKEVGSVLVASDSNVGVGTTAPAVKLDVVGDIRSSTGILFGTDTAAANLLDDYEEGTFTPVPVGWTTNPTSLSGKYTKIGALVSIKFTFTGGVKANATSAYFTGLPFAGAEAGGGTVSSTGVDDLGIVLLDNSDRIWLTQSVFTGFVAKGTGSYMLV